jgi:hypothetical protein
MASFLCKEKRCDMAINAIKNVDPNGVGHLAFDGNTTLEEVGAYAKSNNLKLGTDLINADTGKVYMMNSNFEFTEL